MSALRKRFRVQWDNGEPVEVTTNAWDVTRAQDHQSDPMLATFAIMHAALERTGHTVPPLRAFVDVLDDFVDLDEGAEEDQVPPTPPAPGVNEPLLSR